MKRLLSALLLSSLLLGLGGCAYGAAETAAERETIQVYRLAPPGEDAAGTLLEAETVTLEKGGDRLHAALNRLGEEPANARLTAVLPRAVSILSYSLEDGELCLELSRDYLDLEGMDKTLADYGTALTLCALDEVDTVSIYVDGRAVTTGLRAENALLYDTESDPYNKQVRLYFAMEDGRYLAQEYHSLFLGADTSLERCVVEELLRGPGDEELHSAIPAGTELLDLSTENGLCTVTLSEEFFLYRPETALGERLALYEIVNSLTSLATVESVRITAPGMTLGTYLYIDLSRPLERNEAIVYTSDSRRSTVDTQLYFLTRDGRLAALPRLVRRDDYVTLEQNILESLMADPGEAGYESVFRNTDRVISAETRGGVCTVNLPAAFYDERSAESGRSDSQTIPIDEDRIRR